MRGIRLDEMADELKKDQFTGYCTISRDKSEIVMVFRKGALLLARYDAMEGDAAWDRIGSLGNDTVDAVLSNLSDMQVELALEFNSNARIKRSPSREHRTPAPPARKVRVAEPDISRERVVPVQNERRRPEEIPPPPPIREKETLEKSTSSKPEQSASVPPGEDYSGLYKELDALDSMDIESMTQKIRNNCMVMIEKLNLEHLIETKKGRGGE